jgi:thioredoxin reductase
MNYDYIIIGAGFYGLFAADFLSKKGANVLVLERDRDAFQRASYINQARVHNGYHYPRSLATAQKTREYFDKFNEVYGYSVYSEFDKIYAISKNFSLTSPDQFENFCKAAGIPLEPVITEKYFDKDQVLAGYKTKEYTYDAKILAAQLLKDLNKKNVSIQFNEEVKSSQIRNELFEVTTQSGKQFSSPRVLNATYASLNQINQIFGYEKEKIKYELCEVILVTPSANLKNLGLTLMDGPFLSIMPFGKTPYHTLTAVSYTPIESSSKDLPHFQCMDRQEDCSPSSLNNCDFCPSQPPSTYPYMNQMARKYLNDSLEYKYHKSLFTIKTVLQSSEMDDSRPTVIREKNRKPLYRTVLSGKINTVFDLEEELTRDLQN